MKKELILFFSSLGMFFVIPNLLRFFIKRMSLDFWLLSWVSLSYIIYPAFFIVSGLVLSKDMKRAWYMPLFLAIVYFVSIITNKQVTENDVLFVYVFYVIQYLFLGYFSMFTCWLIIKKDKTLQKITGL